MSSCYTSGANIHDHRLCFCAVYSCTYDSIVHCALKKTCVVCVVCAEEFRGREYQTLARECCNYDVVITGRSSNKRKGRSSGEAMGEVACTSTTVGLLLGYPETVFEALL